MKTLAILFGGAPETARYMDGTALPVFVRILPERHLLDQMLRVMENGSATIELCVYVKEEHRLEGEPAHPEIPAPKGYAPVPKGWADNLHPDSLAQLYEKAKELNFIHAVRLAEARLAAKQQVAPLMEKTIDLVVPLLVRVMDPLMKRLDAFSSSTPSAPSSSAVVAKSS